jgi:hypothetical protein
MEEKSIALLVLLADGASTGFGSSFFGGWSTTSAPPCPFLQTVPEGIS